MATTLPYADVDSSLKGMAGRAEGFGRSAVGGAHGPVHRVTSLAGNLFNFYEIISISGLKKKNNFIHDFLLILCLHMSEFSISRYDSFVKTIRNYCYPEQILFIHG